MAGHCDQVSRVDLFVKIWMTNIPLTALKQILFLFVRNMMYLPYFIIYIFYVNEGPFSEILYRERCGHWHAQKGALNIAYTRININIVSSFEQQLYCCAVRNPCGESC